MTYTKLEIFRGDTWCPIENEDAAYIEAMETGTSYRGFEGGAWFEHSPVM